MCVWVCVGSVCVLGTSLNHKDYELKNLFWGTDELISGKYAEGLVFYSS